MSEIATIFAEKYLTSIQNPPQTLEGHINHENGIINDYRGRAIYEFFQNAIDRAHERIWIRMDTVKQELIIANDGQPFSIRTVDKQRYSDFSAVCSINTSSKNQNESIGNKGVGFKSCWEYTDQVTVMSEHQIEGVEGVTKPWAFTMCNPLTTEKLLTWAETEKEIFGWLNKQEIQAVIGQDGNGKGKIPSFYFPQRRIDVPTKPHGMEKAVTVITFDAFKPGKIEELKRKIHEFAKHQIFFVNQLSKLSDKRVTLTLEIDDQVIATPSTQASAQDWLIVSKNDFSGEELAALMKESRELNYPVDTPKVAIAFPLKEELLTPLKESDTLEINRSLFYCYLPTQEVAGFNVMIHGDFLLDVSRKNIDFESNKYNQLLLNHAADLFVQTLRDAARLHELPFFAKFLTLTDANKFLRQRVEAKLGPVLPEILKKVYTPNRDWHRSAYELVIDAIESWESKHIPWEAWADTTKRTANQIQQFCGKDIHIVPVLDEEKPGSITHLPDVKQGAQYSVSLFYRSSEQLVTSHLNIDLLTNIPHLAISSFKRLESKVLNDLNLVRKFATLPLVTALANTVEKDASHKSEILKFCCQLAADLLDKPERPTERADFFSDKDYPAKQFGRILLPCVGNQWHPALQCYAYIDDDIAKSFDVQQFFKVDLDEFNNHLSGSNTKAALKVFGVWVNSLPLLAKLDKLAWDNCPPQNAKIKQLVNDSIKEWGQLAEKGNIKQLLLSQAWFMDDNKAGKINRPSEVFLYEKNDNRKMFYICKEQKQENLEDLYRFLDIRKIEDTFDILKIMLQLEKMTVLDPKENDHVPTYKSLIKRLGQLRSESTELLALTTMPVLVQTLAGDLTYVSNRDNVMFVPAEQKRYKFHYPQCRFVCFDEDMSKSFVNEFNIETVSPKFEIAYRDAQGNATPRVSDENFKRQFEKTPIYLASLFAIAESTQGSKFVREESIDRWQQLRVYKADNVVMTINSVDYQGSLGKNTDVLYKPLSDNQRSNNKTIVGELAHDLTDPFHHPAISKFGSFMAEAVFRDLRLGNLLSDYLTKCYLSQHDSTNIDGNTVDIRMDFLYNQGLSEQDIISMQSCIQEQLLSEEEFDVLLTALRQLTGATNLVKHNIRELQHYKNLKMSKQELMTALKLDEKYKTIVMQIDPIWTNQRILRNELDKLQLIIDIHNIENQQNVILNSADEIINEIKPLLDRFDFSLMLVLEHYKHKGVRTDISEFDQAIFRLKRDHDLFSTSDSAEISVAQNINPDSAKHVASIQAFNAERKSHEEEGQRKRGIGTELLLCYEAAHEFLKYHRDNLEALINALIAAVNTEIMQPQSQSFKDNFLSKLRSENLAVLTTKRLAELLHASHGIGDGLGYDIFYPEVQESKIIVLKVEVKSGRNKIYLSESERLRVLHFAERPGENWRLWLNHKGNNCTDAVIKAVQVHQQSLLEASGRPLFAETWYLTF